jgi:hypothetical protein
LWIWSLKDHVRDRAQEAGKPHDWWEKKVKASWDLQVCADLANTEKHGSLSRSWTGVDPHFGRARFRMTHTALNSMTFTPGKVAFDISRPEEVDWEVPILDSKGNVMGDALAVLDAAMDAWESALNELEGAV